MWHFHTDGNLNLNLPKTSTWSRWLTLLPAIAYGLYQAYISNHLTNYGPSFILLRLANGIYSGKYFALELSIYSAKELKFTETNEINFLDVMTCTTQICKN